MPNLPAKSETDESTVKQINFHEKVVISCPLGELTSYFDDLTILQNVWLASRRLNIGDPPNILKLDFSM